MADQWPLRRIQLELLADIARSQWTVVTSRKETNHKIYDFFKKWHRNKPLTSTFRTADHSTNIIQLEYCLSNKERSFIIYKECFRICRRIGTPAILREKNKSKIFTILRVWRRVYTTCWGKLWYTLHTVRCPKPKYARIQSLLLYNNNNVHWLLLMLKRITKRR